MRASLLLELAHIYYLEARSCDETNERLRLLQIAWALNQRARQAS